MVRSAYREAVGYFEQALSALPHLPQTRDTREQAIDLRLALCWALRLLGDLARVLVYLREAEALATALDDPRRLAQVSIALSGHFRSTGADDQAITAAQQALALATADGDVAQQAQANHLLGLAYYAQGDYRRAIDCGTQTVVALGGERHRERFGPIFLLAVQSRALLAWCHAELGTFAEGRACGEEGLRIAEAVDHPGSLMWACWGIALLALRQGDLSRALPLLERAMGLCQDAGFQLFLPCWRRTWSQRTPWPGASLTPCRSSRRRYCVREEWVTGDAVRSHSGRRRGSLAIWKRRTLSLRMRWRSPVSAGTWPPGVCAPPPRRHCGAA